MRIDCWFSYNHAISENFMSCGNMWDDSWQLFLPTEAATGVLYKKGVLENFAKFTGKHLHQGLVLNKVSGQLQVLASNFIKKRDSGTEVFLWILQNFSEHLFNRTPPGDCICTNNIQNSNCDKNNSTDKNKVLRTFWP